MAKSVHPHKQMPTTPMDVSSLFIRVKLSALWACLMFLYAYADLLSFYRPGIIEKMLEGFIGPFEVTQGALLTASLLMIIPTLFIALPLFTATKWARGLCLGFAVLYTLVNITNLVGESWTYFIIYGALECIVTISIAVIAYKWPLIVSNV